MLTQGATAFADPAVFTDIDASFAKDAIMELQRMGIVDGVSGDTFAPQTYIARQDFAVLIAKALQLDVSNPPSTATFRDIPVVHYAFPYVEALVKANIFQGEEEGSFGEGKTLTREQLAVVLARAKQIRAANNETGPDFADKDDISEWAKAAVQAVNKTGLMVGDGQQFAPKRPVTRQEMAEVVSRLLHLPAGQEATGLIRSLAGDTVTVDQHTYAVGDSVKGILNEANRDVLDGAAVTFDTKDNTITKLTSLTLHKSGREPKEAEEEFGGNLVLDGQGNRIEGNLDIQADFITIRNLQVSGNFRIGDELKNDFYGKNLYVKGTTVINGGSSHTIVFDNASLDTVQINKQEVRVEAIGNTTTGDVVVSANATVTADPGVTIPKLTVTDGAANVEINANVSSLQLESSQPAVIGGSGNIQSITVSGTAAVTIQTTGTIGKLEVTNKDVQITIPPGVQVQSIVLPDGAAASDVIANYAAVSGQIGSVTSASGQTVSGGSASSGGSSSSHSSKVLLGAVSGFVYYGAANKPLANATVTVRDLTATTGSDGSYELPSVPAGTGLMLSVAASGYVPNPYTTTLDVFGGQTTTVPVIVLGTATNHAPVVAQAIPKQTISLGEEEPVFNLNERFSDEDGDILKFTVVSLNTKVVKTEINGSILKLIPVGAGTASIAISANDGKGKSVNSTFSVTVTAAPVNHDPKVSAAGLADQTAMAGEPEISVSLAGSFTDEDGDALSFNAVSSNESSVTAAVYGSVLKLKPLQAGVSSIRVTAEDGKGGKATASFTMTVTSEPPANHAPKVATAIPVQSGTEQGSAVEYDLSGTFTDEDGDALTLSAVSSNTSVATVSITGSKVEITLVAPGESMVTVKAADGRGGEVTTSFKMTVQAANHAPKVAAAIPAQSGTEQGSAVVYDLSGTFTDEDGDALTLSAVSSNTSVATVSITGSKLEITPVAPGESTVTVKASDGQGGEVTTSFKVTVKAANHAPKVAAAIPAQSGTEQGSAVEYDLSGTFTDEDGDALTLSAVSSNARVATVSITGSKVEITPVAPGESTVTVKASDGQGGEVTTSFKVTVQAANHAPKVAAAIPAQSGTEQGSAVEYDLSGTFTDEDGDALTLSAVSSNTSVATVSITGSKVEITPVAPGESTVTVKAADGRGGEVTTSFQMTVQAANHAPKVAAAIPAQSGTEQGSAVVYDLSGTFTDEDGDALTLSAVSSNTSVATVSITGSKVEITPVAPGESTVTVKAADGRGGEVTTSFQMTVQAANHAPVIQPIPDQSVTSGDSPLQLDISSYVQDADGDVLTITADTKDPSIATVTVTGNMLSISAKAAGQTEITVHADDHRGGVTAGTIRLTVTSKSNQIPVVEAAIYEQVLTATVTNSRSFDLSQLFYDADEDVLQFTASADVPNIAQVTVSGSMLTLSPGSTAGSAQVTVTANDGNGGVAAYTFTVRNAPLTAGNAFVTYTTKQGVSDFSYDLSTLFPGQTQFKVYKGTPDSTFVGPTPLGGKVVTLANDSMYTWVIGADGKAAVFKVVVEPQGAPELFFSQYLDGGDGRIAIELYYKGDGDPSHKATGYSVDVYQWAQGKMQITSTKIASFSDRPAENGVYAGVPYIFINAIFYDYFDLTNTSYYNNELNLYLNDGNTVALVLKKDGQVVDVLGDPNSHERFMPNGGTIIRKRGIYTGSKSFSDQGEWTSYPKGTYQFFGAHTI
ncbi:S-layer homology domain-containing protein [Paenibacillus konkukensis]|uniref:S-layer homology domain-containing protein n=1 Tax=Paenibacillus konkukensis TaxID=2020716 RepID=UPI00201D309F|nr:S-layer homology domain-containing protein [Paenibacillus konkukensis]